MKNEKELTSGDFYHLGLCSELKSDFKSTLRYYNKSLKIKNDIEFAKNINPIDIAIRVPNVFESPSATTP